MTFRRHLDWLRFRSIGQPLLQEQCCCGAVQFPTAISMKMMSLSGGPAAAVLVHKGHGKRQGTSQADSIALAVFRLHGGVAEVIQREAHYQSLDPAFSAELPQFVEIVAEHATFEGIQRSHSHSQSVASSQTDPSATHIKAESRSGAGRGIGTH